MDLTPPGQLNPPRAVYGKYVLLMLLVLFLSFNLFKWVTSTEPMDCSVYELESGTDLSYFGGDGYGFSICLPVDFKYEASYGSNMENWGELAARFKGDNGNIYINENVEFSPVTVDGVTIYSKAEIASIDSLFQAIKERQMKSLEATFLLEQFVVLPDGTEGVLYAYQYGRRNDIVRLRLITLGEDCYYSIAMEFNLQTWDDEQDTYLNAFQSFRLL